jgi:hypothetical protein
MFCLSLSEVSFLPDGGKGETKESVKPMLNSKRIETKMFVFISLDKEPKF